MLLQTIEKFATFSHKYVDGQSLGNNSFTNTFQFTVKMFLQKDKKMNLWHFVKRQSILNEVYSMQKIYYSQFLYSTVSSCECFILCSNILCLVLMSIYIFAEILNHYYIIMGTILFYV